MLRVAHVSDLHIGAFPRYWRLRKKTLEVFREVVEEVENGDYQMLLISGDLFDLSHPSIDELREVAEMLRRLRDSGVRVCAISGSHDITATRLSILEVYEEAGLLYYLNPRKYLSLEEGALKVKGLEFEDLGVSIAGVPGLRRSLEIEFYNKGLVLDSENPTIFMFHTAISGVEEGVYVESMPMDFLPKNKNIIYYAGGHVHTPFKTTTPWSNVPIVYPGTPLGRDFNDLKRFVLRRSYLEEKGYSRGFVRVELDIEDPENSRVEWVGIRGLPRIEYGKFEFEDASVEEVLERVRRWIEALPSKNIEVAVIDLSGSVRGDLTRSNVLTPIYKKAYEVGVTVHITSTLISRRREILTSKPIDSIVSDLEIFRTVLGEDDYELAYKLFQVISEREPEGGRKRDYLERMIREAKEVLGLGGGFESEPSDSKRGLMRFLRR